MAWAERSDDQGVLHKELVGKGVLYADMEYSSILTIQDGVTFFGHVLKNGGIRVIVFSRQRCQGQNFSNM